MKFLILLALVFSVIGRGENNRLSTQQQFLEIKNLLKNPGLEFAKSDWTVSGGTFTITTTSSQVARGQRAASWDGSATAQTLTTGSYTIPAGMFGQNCLAQIHYQNTESSVPYTLEALDGSNNVLGSVSLTDATGVYTRAEAPFICPSSGSIKLRVRTNSSAGNPAVIYLDDAFLGRNYLITNVSQSKLMGGATWAAIASCTWSTTSNSFANFSADTDCTSPTGASLQGTASAPSTKVPGITFTSLPPGRYYITATGSFGRANTSTPADWRFSDGTNTSQEQRLYLVAATEDRSNFVSGWLTYTTAQSGVTIQLQAKNGDGSTAVSLDASAVPLDIQVYYFPTFSQQAVSIDQAGWRVSADISGADISLSTSAVTIASNSDMANGSLTLASNTGSATVWVSCSGGNDATGTTCSSGNEEDGISFTIPYAGSYKICNSFQVYQDVGAAGATGNVYASFRLVETPNTSATPSQTGIALTASTAVETNSRVDIIHPVTLCDTFYFSTAGRKTVRTYYSQTVGGTVNAETVYASTAITNNTQKLHWEVMPVERAWPMPIVVGGVSSNSTGQERIERAIVNCDAGSAITSQSGTWISSIGNIASSISCAITLTSGIFSATPTCTASEQSTSDRIVNITASSATALSVRCQTDAGAGCASYDANIICMGPK